MNTISKKIIANYFILFLGILTIANSAWAQQTITHKDQSGRVVWYIYVPANPAQNATGTFYQYANPTGAALYSRESVKFHTNYHPSFYPLPSYYLITSKNWYNITDGRIQWAITFPENPTQNATGIYYQYANPTGAALYSRESVKFHTNYHPSFYPLPSYYLITSKNWYNISNGKLEWAITFPSNSTLSATGYHYFYSPTGTISKLELVRFPVTFNPSSLPSSGFYEITAINYYNARGQTEWVVNFPSNPASSPTGYHFIFDASGVFKQLDYLTYNRHAPTATVPYMQYTVTKSVTF